MYLSCLFVLCTTLMFISGAVIWSELRDRKNAKDELQELQDIVMTPPTVEDTTAPDMGESVDDAEEQILPERTPKRNLAPLLSQNEDCIGWVHIADTSVDYPVMHTPNIPQKYLRMNFNKEFSYAGIPFMDARCTEESDNVILYGHNMKDGTMFSDILLYAEHSYFEEHPIIEFETADGCLEYRVFAVAVVKQTDQWFRFVDAEDEDEFWDYVEKIQEQALYDTDIDPVYGGQCLTLSTCDNRDNSIRFLVIACAP